MLVTLSVSNTSRARSWRFARATSSSVSPSVRTRSISLRAPPLRATRATRRRIAVSEACRGTAARSAAAHPPRPTRDRARRAPCRAGRCAAAARRGSWTRGSAPFAPVSAASSTSIGKKSGSVAAGACHANFRYAVVPSRSTSDAALADLRRLDATAARRRGAAGDRRRSASRRAAARRPVSTSPTTTSVALFGT